MNNDRPFRKHKYLLMFASGIVFAFTFVVVAHISGLIPENVGRMRQFYLDMNDMAGPFDTFIQYLGAGVGGFMFGSLIVWFAYWLKEPDHESGHLPQTLGSYDE
jgi:hypothetical protein